MRWNSQRRTQNLYTDAARDLKVQKIETDAGSPYRADSYTAEADFSQLRMSFDNLLTDLGEFGLYQLRVVFFLALNMMAISWHLFCQIFYTLPVDHWCKVPELNECKLTWNITENECYDIEKTISVPPENGPVHEGNKGQSHCYRYVTNVNNTEYHLHTGVQNDSETIPCDAGWSFNTDRETIITDFQLFCSRSSWPDVAYSIYFAGILCGCILCVLLGDRVGRRSLYVVGCVISPIAGVAAAFSPNIWIYSSCRFVIGFTHWPLTSAIIVIGTEIVGPSWRVTSGVIMWTAYSVGFIVLAGLAYLLSSWRIIQIIISLPFILNIIFSRFIPESPRWLLAQGRIEEAEKILRKMATVNKKKLPLNIMIELKEELEDAQCRKNQTFIHLFFLPTLRWRTLNIMFNWFIQSLVYFGLSLSLGGFGVNIYIAMCINGVVEIASNALSMPSLQVIGRRMTLLLTLVPGGVACICTIFTPPGLWKTAVAMIGKFGITLSFNSMYIISVENFPTTLRASGLSVCALCARAGGMLCPLVLLLDNVWPPFSILIFGCSGVLAGLLALLLPETKDQPMPQTLQDSAVLGKKRSKFQVVQDETEKEEMV